jgi:hypothetical protein
VNKTLKIILSVSLLLLLNYALFIVISKEDTENDGNLYFLELSDPSTYSVSCFNQIDSKWVVAGNTCTLETSEIDLYFNTTKKVSLDIPIDISISSSGNLTTKDYAMVEFYNNNSWQVLDSIPGNIIPTRPYKYCYWIRNIFSGSNIKIRITFSTTEESKKLLLQSRNERDFCIGTPYISGTPKKIDKHNNVVTFRSFNAKESNGFVKLNWVTKEEYNNSYFTIEKSINGLSFDSVSTLYGKKYSNAESVYSFKENIIDYKNIYYRLKYTDINGTSGFSEVVLVKNNKYYKESCKLNVNPSPCFGKCSISMDNCKDSLYKHYYFSIVDAIGNVIETDINTKNFKGFTLIYDSENNLKPGILLINLPEKNNSKKL